MCFTTRKVKDKPQNSFSNPQRKKWVLKQNMPFQLEQKYFNRDTIQIWWQHGDIGALITCCFLTESSGSFYQSAKCSFLFIQEVHLYESILPKFHKTTQSYISTRMAIKGSFMRANKRKQPKAY